MYEIKRYTPEQHRAALEMEVREFGLKIPIGRRLDEIDEFAASLPYIQHRNVQEMCAEILELIDIANMGGGETNDTE